MISHILNSTILILSSYFLIITHQNQRNYENIYYFIPFCCSFLNLNCFILKIKKKTNFRNSQAFKLLNFLCPVARAGIFLMRMTQWFIKLELNRSKWIAVLWIWASFYNINFLINIDSCKLQFKQCRVVV